MAISSKSASPNGAPTKQGIRCHYVAVLLTQVIRLAAKIYQTVLILIFIDNGPYTRETCVLVFLSSDHFPRIY